MLFALGERMGRIRDAAHALFGRSTAQVEIIRMRAEWVDLQLEIASILEKLNTWAARVAKRDSRAAKETLEQLSLEPTEHAVSSRPPLTARHAKRDHKAALRARVQAKETTEGGLPNVSTDEAGARVG